MCANPTLGRLRMVWATKQTYKTTVSYLAKALRLRQSSSLEFHSVCTLGTPCTLSLLLPVPNSLCYLLGFFSRSLSFPIPN